MGNLTDKIEGTYINMRKEPFILILLYSFFFLAGSAYGVGEKIFNFGAESSWALIEKKTGIIEAPNIRPEPVLVLAEGPAAENPAAVNSSLYAADDNALDLYLSFDEKKPERFSDSMGRYDLSVSPELSAVAAPWSRIGAGAAQFSGNRASGGAPLVLKPNGSALFAPGNHIRDFTIEFWLYPLETDNGGQVLSWSSSKPGGKGGAYLSQRIQCTVIKNRIQWNFEDFFFSPDEKNAKLLTLTGPVLFPRTWSHHLIRFDADLGLLEYLVDGKVESLDYATSTGREASYASGEVYTPVIGENCRLELGGRFTGMMDEFHIYRSYVEKAELAKYSSQGGRVESRTLDMGIADSRVLKLEAFGGRTSGSLDPVASGKVRNEYAGNALLSFSDHSEMRFFIRTSNDPYRWNDVPWVPVSPGKDLPDTFRGRFVQIAADFYPSGDGEASPYLSELNVIYRAADAPPPPTQVMAVAKDGAVELSWKASPSKDAGGYLVYYGTAKGEYFGDQAVLTYGAGDLQLQKQSPVDVGNRTSVRIDGLRNGTLYYFAVAAYNKPYVYSMNVPDPGEFSRETAARPLRMAE